MMGCGRTMFNENGESTGFICGSGVVACAICGGVADSLCDYPMGKGKTCDAPLCNAHAIRIGLRLDNKRPFCQEPEPDENGEYDMIEFCPQHAAISGLKNH